MNEVYLVLGLIIVACGLISWALVRRGKGQELKDAVGHVAETVKEDAPKVAATAVDWAKHLADALETIHAQAKVLASPPVQAAINAPPPAAPVAEVAGIAHATADDAKNPPLYFWRVGQSLGLSGANLVIFVTECAGQIVRNGGNLDVDSITMAAAYVAGTRK